jgi:hypothetical protein
MSYKIKQSKPKVVKEASFDKKYWSMDMHDGKYSLSLGNMSDAGWFWDGDEKSITGFMMRIGKSKVNDEFVSEMKKNHIPFSQHKKAMIQAVEKDNDGLYELSGDNARWHFGDELDYDEGIEQDLKDDDLYSEEDKSKIIRNFSPERVTYEEFEKEYGSVYKKKMKEIISSSESYEEFFKKTADEDMTYDIEEKIMEMNSNTQTEQFYELIKQMEKDGEITPIKKKEEEKKPTHQKKLDMETH